MSKLSKNQIEKLSDIFSDVGLVALASIVIPAVLNKFDIILVSIGFIFTILSWIISLRLRK